MSTHNTDTDAVYETARVLRWPDATVTVAADDICDIVRFAGTMIEVGLKGMPTTAEDVDNVNRVIDTINRLAEATNTVIHQGTR